MKKRNLFICGIFLFLLAFACSKELEHAPPVDESGDFVNFDAVSAQAYFETNATDLAPLRFSDSVSTKSVGAELIPEWDKAMVSANGEVQIVEVPIRSNRAYISVENVMENGKLAFQKFHITRRRLVVARQRSGNIAMFVITLHPSATAGGNPDKSIENFRYLSGGDFIGLVFCSALDGRYIEAKEYTGQQISPVKVSTRRQWMEHGENLDTMSYQAIQFSETIMTRASTYSSEECEIHGSSICNCLDEAIVVRCQGCQATLEPGETCSCCKYCKAIPCECRSLCSFCRPGVCTVCSCGSHACGGRCSSGGGNTGGGSSGGSTGGGSTGGGSSGGGGGTVPPDPWYPPAACEHIRCGGCRLPINVDISPSTRSSSCNHVWCSCAWWTKDHNTITKLGLKDKLTDAQYREFHKGQIAVDTMQKVYQSPYHAMIAPNQTKEEAINEMKKHFCEYVVVFSQTNDFKALGMAIHPIQDAYSPAHDFNVWTGANLLPHLFESILNYPNQALAAAKATNRIYEEIKASPKPITSTRVKAIFDTWRYRYENRMD